MPHSVIETPQSFPVSAPAARSREDRNKETALYHAELLQERKNTESSILAFTEALLDLPTSPSADPARPGLSDVILFKNALKSFQPSDYDALIDERRINDQCGYVLCPRHNRKQDTKAKYRILHGGGSGAGALKVVLTQSLESWCSDDCGKRALYVRVQLDEEPAWNRMDQAGRELTLLEEHANHSGDSISEMELIEGISTLGISVREDDVAERMKALAIERGDGSTPSRSRGLGTLSIRDKITPGGNATSPQSDSVDRHNSIEGYLPKFSDQIMRGMMRNDDEEDMMPTI